MADTRADEHEPALVTPVGTIHVGSDVTIRVGRDAGARARLVRLDESESVSVVVLKLVAGGAVRIFTVGEVACGSIGPVGSDTILFGTDGITEETDA